jgi:hypothetical protein
VLEQRHEGVHGLARVAVGVHGEVHRDVQAERVRHDVGGPGDHQAQHEQEETEEDAHEVGAGADALERVLEAHDASRGDEREREEHRDGDEYVVRVREPALGDVLGSVLGVVHEVIVPSAHVLRVEAGPVRGDGGIRLVAVNAGHLRGVNHARQEKQAECVVREERAFVSGHRADDALQRSERDERARDGHGVVGLLERRERHAVVRVDALDQSGGSLFVRPHHRQRDAEPEQRDVQHEERQTRKQRLNAAPLGFRHLGDVSRMLQLSAKRTERSNSNRSPFERPKLTTSRKIVFRGVFFSRGSQSPERDHGSRGVRSE